MPYDAYSSRLSFATHYGIRARLFFPMLLSLYNSKAETEQYFPSLQAYRVRLTRTIAHSEPVLCMIPTRSRSNGTVAKCLFAFPCHLAQTLTVHVLSSEQGVKFPSHDPAALNATNFSD